MNKMNPHKTLFAAVLLFLIVGCSVKKNHSSTNDYSQSNTKSEVADCQDSMYKHTIILNTFLSALVKTINDSVYNDLLRLTMLEKPFGFFIYDLSDTMNNSENGNVCFYDRHVYHFAPYRNTISYSHIAFLENGYVKIFSAINCPEYGDDINDVLLYLSNKNLDKKDSVLQRIKMYRNYGFYIKTDSHSTLNCNRLIDESK